MAKSLTAAEIEKMTLPQLRLAAGKVYDADDIKGLRKEQLITQLKEYYAEDDEVDDELDDPIADSEPDDELDDEEVDDELDDLEEEVDEPPAKPKKGPKPPNDAPAKKTPPEPKGDTLTAKQVATRIGTDAKTLRKFFRSPASTIEPCGQGGRYEFAKEDMAQIKAEFEKWNSTKGTRTAKADGPKKPRTRAEAAPANAIIEADEELDLDDEEPDDDELDDLELDDELDDDELDD